MDQLRALYERTLQRTTGPTDRGYLIWMAREARTGNVEVGPVEHREEEAAGKAEQPEGRARPPV